MGTATLFRFRRWIATPPWTLVGWCLLAGILSLAPRPGWSAPPAGAPARHRPTPLQQFIAQLEPRPTSPPGGVADQPPSAAGQQEPLSPADESTPEAAGEDAADDAAKPAGAGDATEGSALAPGRPPPAEYTKKAARVEASLGAGLGAVNLPLERDLTKRNTPIDLFFDQKFKSPWRDISGLFVRLGVNRADAEIPGGLVSTTALYAVLRKEFPQQGGAILYGMGGLAIVSTRIEGIANLPEAMDSGFGTLVGIGALGDFRAIRIGIQTVVIRREASIGLSPFVTGSTQFQLFLDFPLR